jgi:hypothetical protein
MSAERGWIGEPQPARQWHDSHYSRQADRIAASAQEPAGLNRRYAHLHTPKHLTNPDHYEPSKGTPGPPLRLAPRYAGGRPRHV